jgi:hypothetical protein
VCSDRSALGRFQSLVGETGQRSLAGFGERPERSPPAFCATQNAFRYSLANVVLLAERSVAAYPLKSHDHIRKRARIKITFNHEQAPMIGLTAAKRAPEMMAAIRRAGSALRITYKRFHRSILET